MSQKVISLSHIQVFWFFRQVVAYRNKVDAKIKSLTGEFSDEAMQKEYQGYCKEREELEAMAGKLEYLVYLRKNLHDAEVELKDAITCNDNEEAKAKAKDSLEKVQNQLSTLPERDEDMIHDIPFSDRASIKFVLAITEADIQKFKLHVIPHYENAKDTDYPDPVETRIYYVNKAKKSRDILEQLKIKLEKAL